MALKGITFDGTSLGLKDEEARQMITAIQQEESDMMPEIKKLSDLVYTGHMTFDKADFESGSWSFSTKSASIKRIRSKRIYKVSSGTKFTYKNPSWKLYIGVLGTETANAYTQSTNWVAASNTETEFTVASDGYVNIVLETSDGSAADVNDYDCVIKMYR